LLLSMTGFGEARSQREGLAVSVELRTVNSRYLKLSTRVTEGYGSVEPLIESIVRGRIRRGTVQVWVRVSRVRSPEDFRINQQVLSRYRQQIEAVRREWQMPDHSVVLERLLELPGVVEEVEPTSSAAAGDWPAIREALEAAIDNMERMRLQEGQAMAADLKANCDLTAGCLAEIERRAPLVQESYRARLEERLRKALADFQVTLEPADLLREVSLFGERSDISEEVVRLRSHLEQFGEILASPDGSGRKLEFLTQEMFREANTIGSKANDVEIARHVIEIKAAIERVREMIQNIE
jgi:uncharacterized protein (TIGR00255 family)